MKGEIRLNGIEWEHVHTDDCLETCEICRQALCIEIAEFEKIEGIIFCIKCAKIEHMLNREDEY